MSSLSYLEIVQTDGQPSVSLGHVNVEEVGADHPQQSTRLRIYISNNHDSFKFSFELFRLIEPLLMLAAGPSSSIRDEVNHHWQYASQQRFFLTSLIEVSEGVPFIEILWRSMEGWLVKVRNDILFLEASGERVKMLALLDAIRDALSKRDGTDTPAVAPASIDPHQAAIEFRDELLRKNWLDAESVAALVGTRPGNDANRHAARLRAQGTLLGVWSAQDRGFLYPDFQFNAGGVRPEVSKLLKVLPVERDDRSGWRRAFWLYSPHAKLDGKMPVDAFVSDPSLVIDVARSEFQGEPDASW